MMVVLLLLLLARTRRREVDGSLVAGALRLVVGALLVPGALLVVALSHEVHKGKRYKLRQTARPTASGGSTQGHRGACFAGW